MKTIDLGTSIIEWNQDGKIVPSTPQHIGVVESMNQTLTERGRSICM